MYRVTVWTGGKEYVLHDIHDQDEQIYDDELSEEMGKTATFRFTMSPNHPNADKIIPLSSEIRISKGKEQVFWGRAITPTADIHNTQTVQCVGGLSYLADSQQAPATHTGAGTTFLEQVLAVHNSMVEPYKQLKIGMVNVAIRNAERVIEAYTDTLTVLTSLLVSNYGGYLRVREAGGVRYLDYLTDYGGTNKQTIRSGENVLDLNRETDATDIITVLIPEGEEVNGNRVDITSVNGGVNYITNAKAVEKWGRIWGYRAFEDVSDPAELLSAATDYLGSIVTYPQTINLTAFDLGLVDSSIETLHLGYWTNFISVPHGNKGTYILKKLVRHLTAPQNDNVIFGGVQETISGTTANTSQVVTQKVEQVKQSIGKEISEKIENATKLITGGTGGYFVIGLNDSGQPNETFWMDAPTIEKARYVVRMNRNGLGFSTNGIDGPYENAITIDGNVVADFITTGTMLADRIRGGTMEVGGTGLAKDGVIYVRDSAGSIIVQIDKNGIVIKKGSINLGDGAFSVTSGGVMNLSGTNNSSTIGCSILSAQNANIDRMTVNGTSEMRDTVCGDVYGDDIQCTQIYSSRAGEWWSDRRMKDDINPIPIDEAFASLYSSNGLFPESMICISSSISGTM